MLYNKDTNMDKNALIIFCHADKRQKIHNYLCRCMAAERSFLCKKEGNSFCALLQSFARCVCWPWRLYQSWWACRVCFNRMNLNEFMRCHEKNVVFSAFFVKEHCTNCKKCVTINIGWADNEVQNVGRGQNGA